MSARASARRNMMADEHILVADFRIGTPEFTLRVRLQARDEVVVVFGPSGAGKSMSLRALAGLRAPDEGHIALRGRTLFDSRRGINLPPQRRRIGYVPQDYGLFPHRTIAENIAYGLHDTPSEQRRARVRELLSLMQLETLAERPPSQVSGGEAQRAALARALAIRPDLLLMDEPFAAVEETLRTHLRTQLQDIQRRFRIPVLLVTHSLEEAYLLADQLLVLEHGRTVQHGRRDEVFRQPRTPTVARLMGMSNIYRGVLKGRTAGFCTINCAGLQFRVPCEETIFWGEQVRFGIRPEDVIVIREGRSLDPSIEENVFAGVVVEDQALGFDHLVTIALRESGPEPLRIQARIPHPVFLRLALHPGDQRRISVKPENIRLFPA
jgi:molybdate transport system ATP-binding protein